MNNDYMEYYIFLDALRHTGFVNMYGAVPYLQDVFKLDQKKAIEVLASWMENYDEIHKKLNLFK